ncbi:NAD(P)H-binding protein [Pontibacillus yanchengensis]|uniref:NAD(P)H-binding protein n=2 Tax=Pontibacillus yanchengensis TaxID=462910 RepID=A0ACC7VDW9_9BACI|nr:SDR family oxidoreductase [Pontibacillus yanchengensis]MYL32285.1 NAD(P)H-binding protein [Pontibacillus yanchengensis]MYL52865.1 NAD(P)H-binding protein [Pontibacillus yanchengensis]
MQTLVTGFNGKGGFEVAQQVKEKGIPLKCAVRNIAKAKQQYGDEYRFTSLDFSNPDTFEESLEGVNKLFLMYPPGDNIQFDTFLSKAKKKGIQHIVYLSIKDVQFMPFIHHYKNEKLIKKHNLPYTFLRAGYFMQNLNDFLKDEIIQRNRIFVPAGKGKTSFVDARDIAEVAAICFSDSKKHANRTYTLTGSEALDFYEVAEVMTEVLDKHIHYTNPNAKEFKEFMIDKDVDESFVNVVAGIHFPTKLGLAKGIKHDIKEVTGHQPTNLKTYIQDYKGNWL